MWMLRRALTAFTIYRKFRGYKMPIKINSPQKSDSWKSERRKYITATDVATLISLKKKKLRYGKTFNSWAEAKLGKKKEEFNSFTRDLMRQGDLFEEFFTGGLRESGNIKLTSGETYIKDFLMASLDLFVLEVDGVVKNTPVEIKYTTSKETFETIKSGNLDHHFYYQVCAQMFVMESQIGHLKVGIACPESDTGFEVCSGKITRDSDTYKEFESMLPIFKSLQSQLQSKNLEDPFIEREEQNRLQKITDSIVEAEKDIKAFERAIESLKDRIVVSKEILSNEIKGDFSEPVTVNGVEKKWKIETKDSMVKKLKDGYCKKDIYNEPTLKDGINEEDVYEDILTTKTKISLVKI